MESQKRKPHDFEAAAKMAEFIRNMTPEEAIAFLEYRTPCIEETDMTGHFPINPPRPILASASVPMKKTA